MVNIVRNLAQITFNCLTFPSLGGEQNVTNAWSGELSGGGGRRFVPRPSKYKVIQQLNISQEHKQTN